MKVNWQFVLNVVKQLEGTCETLHDIDLVREMVSFIVLMDSTGIVETGTEKGNTTQFLAMTFPHLHTYTCDKFVYPKVVYDVLDRHKNVTWKTMSSVEFLPVLGVDELGPRPFYFLDAHTRNTENPLAKEMEIIVEKLRRGEFVEAGVCIHDFKVEDRPEFGFNAADFDGTDLCWDTIKFIKPYTKAAWFPLGNPLTQYYRGRIFLYMSTVQPTLPYTLSYLENLGILKRFF